MPLRVSRIAAPSEAFPQKVFVIPESVGFHHLCKLDEYSRDLPDRVRRLAYDGLVPEIELDVVKLSALEILVDRLLQPGGEQNVDGNIIAFDPFGALHLGYCALGGRPYIAGAIVPFDRHHSLEPPVRELVAVTVPAAVQLDLVSLHAPSVLVESARDRMAAGNRRALHAERDLRTPRRSLGGRHRFSCSCSCSCRRYEPLLIWSSATFALSQLGTPRGSVFHTDTELVASGGVPVLEPVHSARHALELPSLIGLIVTSKQPDVSAGLVTSVVDPQAQVPVLVTLDGAKSQRSRWLHRPELVGGLVALALFDICTELGVSPRYPHAELGLDILEGALELEGALDGVGITSLFGARGIGCRSIQQRRQHEDCTLHTFLHA